MKRILGIDTGTNSLGWAVVEKADSGMYNLIKKGSLIFQEGVKIEKGIESSKAAKRTEYKASRKKYFRRRLRKIEVLKVLVKFKLCPFISESALHAWHVYKQYPMEEAFLQWQRTDERSMKNPYYDRHACLNEELDLNDESDRYILGRAIYHLAQRRGFLSNRLAQNDETDDDSGKVKQSISDLTQAMQEAGCTYLGDYFYKIYTEEGNRVKIRSRYTSREEHYMKEFKAICSKQKLPQELVNELSKALYFVRPLKSQRQSVGKCTFEPKYSRCADSHPDYEQFRMLCFINNIQIMGPYDIELRPLKQVEREKIVPLFFRKKRPQFDFEDIAKALAGKKNYQCIKDAGEKPYKFNFRMSQSVTGCPTIAALQSVFGVNYGDAICEQYLLSQNKSKQQMIDDVWNVLNSFTSKDKLKQWAVERLQLDEEKAAKFADIKLSHCFASLSLKAVRRILPWLEKGMIYSHAVLMAKIPDIVGEFTWVQRGSEITKELIDFISNFSHSDVSMQGTLDFCIKDYLKNNFNLNVGSVDKLYHPSMIEHYEDAKPNKDGIYQLGSPKTNAVRNPMAMRSLHQLRKVINKLLREGIISPKTEVHIEYARELNDYNKRTAIARWNKNREKQRAQYAEEIKKLYLEEYGKAIVPTDRDILKFQLWEEQNHTCLYTGESIALSDFIGDNPRYDIEHTIPRSAGGDFTMENMTLCSSRFNREVKKTKLPTELAVHEDILIRIEPWKERIHQLRKAVDLVRTNPAMAKELKDNLIQKRHLIKLDLEYWEGKYKRFLMDEVPDGFSRRQGAGIGLVGKFAGLYLKSLFHRPDDRNKGNVRVIKGTTTAEFRKMWGLQDIYEKKSRDNHIHHCIDAIVIACIEPAEYNATAKYYQQLEEYERGKANKPQFPKPWPTFTEDIKALEKDLLVVHSTPNNLPKQSKRRIKTAKGYMIAQGDTARGSLHNDTYYGAIKCDDKICYVVRKQLSQFTSESDLVNIVDESVKQKIYEAIAEKGFREALSGDINMNKEKGIKIKKVRCFAKDVKNPLNIRNHRDTSRKEYKRQFHVTPDGNYCMAIYEGEIKGKLKRSFELVNILDAANYFRLSSDQKDYYPLVCEEKEGLKFRCILKTGTHVILLQSPDEDLLLGDLQSLAKRLYYVAIMQKDGRIILRHHQEAREATVLKKERKAGVFKEGEDYRSEIAMSLSNFHALIEGYDFEINTIGEIFFKR